ncbi:hypothetical protein Tco_1039511 [Tanacetum coccineum]
MPPTMTTSNAGRRTAASRGERTGRQTGRGGGRTGEQTDRGGGRTGKRGGRGGGRDLLPTIIAQVGDHISNQGINGSRNDNVDDDSIHEDVRNVNVSNGQNRYSYKEFVACKPKEFDGKDGVTRGWEAAVGITWESFKALIKEEYCPRNKIQKLETEFWGHAMVGAGHAMYTD